MGTLCHTFDWVTAPESSTTYLEFKMDAFKGKFERTSSENYEEMLKVLGVNMLLRKAATASTPTVEVTEQGGVWSFKTSTALKSMELKFRLGEQFDETTPDGRAVSSISNFEAGRIVTVQTAKKPGVKSTKSYREMNGPNEFIYTITVDGTDIVCVQNFKRV